ncbi:MAG: M48 family metallopeptidase, partial [Pseudohongiellaceae bacterium]
MDFFESQDTARRNTTRLIVLFALAVLSLIVITNLLVMVLFGFAANGSAAVATGDYLRFEWSTFFIVSALVAGTVLLGSLYKIHALSGGGARVAEMMDGHLLVSGNNDLQEQRMLNVVEEMAIASGTPVPPVYVMEEQGINAFAAGFTPGDAVIGISRGALETLDRDQLQGVVAHEFSHILHGDMRINIRLIGVLHGILILGLVGYHLLRGGVYSRRSKGSGGIVAFGLGLVVIGFVGTFFGNLIKAAVSRQREFLADASAVQFTRNPEGIAGALMQIATHEERSYINHPGGQEISHALFEEAGHSALSSLYATHPPLDVRIAAILPNWDGSYEAASRPASARSEADSAAAESARASAGGASPDPGERLTAILTGTAGVLIGAEQLAGVGTPQQKHLDYAGRVVESIPDKVYKAAHDPSGARAVIYLLVLTEDDDELQQQLAHLRESADQGVYQELENLLAERPAIPVAARLPLVEIAQSSLRQLSARQYKLFRENFQTLIAMDNSISLFEWSLQKIVFTQLDAVFELSKTPKLGRRELNRCPQSVAHLLAMVAYGNKQEGIEPEQAFAAGTAKLTMELELPAREQINLASLSAAIKELQSLKPLQKPALLKAVAACITADQSVTAGEAEVFRAIAVLLDCPMPP